MLDAIFQGWNYRIGGRWWAGGWWYGMAWQSFFRDVVGLEFEDPEVWARHDAYTKMTSAGWAWLHRDFAMVCELPTEIHREEPRGDAVRRLHNATGPAVRWEDGTCVFFVRGVRVDDPEWITDRTKLTPQRILSEQNAEVRRVMIELYGADRYLREADAKKLGEDQYGKLWRLDQRGDEPIVMVEVLNSTPEPIGYEGAPEDVRRGGRVYKTYFIRVDPACRTAHEAVAWTFGKTPDTYAPALET